MNPYRHISRVANRAFARMARWNNGFRVHAVLALWYVPDRMISVLRWIQAEKTPLRAAGVITGFLALTVPGTLYLIERSENARLASDYRYVAISSTAEIATLRQSMGSLVEEQDRLRHFLLDAGYAVSSGNKISIPVVATGYSSSVWETDDTPYITASNTRTRRGVIALSRDLLQRHSEDAPFRFGDTVHLTGIGDFIVEDSMNQRWRRRVDVWFPNQSEARRFGSRPIILTAETGIARDGKPSITYTLPANLSASNGTYTTDSP